jgi:hypothetical protein
MPVPHLVTLGLARRSRTWRWTFPTRGLAFRLLALRPRATTTDLPHPHMRRIRSACLNRRLASLAERVEIDLTELRDNYSVLEVSCYRIGGSRECYRARATFREFTRASLGRMAHWLMISSLPGKPTRVPHPTLAWPAPRRLAVRTRRQRSALDIVDDTGLARAGRGHWVYIRGMLEPVKWRVAISCPLCGAAGSATLSESADEPPRARRIEALSRGFLGTLSGSPAATIFLCAGCQVPAFSVPQGLVGEPLPERRKLSSKNKDSLCSTKNSG